MTAVQEKDILEFIEGVVQRFSPEKIILFGSYAMGEQDFDSDVDLLVVMDTVLRFPDQASEIRKAIRRSFPMDLIVRTPGELKRRLAMGDPFFIEIVEKGQVLYERGI